MNKKNDQNLTAVLWIFLGIVARIIPHPANITPMNSIGLFGGTQLSRWKALSITVFSLAISDMILSKIMGYPAFGGWSLFTYSGFAAIVLAGGLLRKNASAGRTAGFLVCSSVGYWLWTNFGVWLGESLYTHSGAGLLDCYIAALPFLRNALAGDLVWGAIFFGSFAYARKQAGLRGFAILGA